VPKRPQDSECTEPTTWSKSSLHYPNVQEANATAFLIPGFTAFDVGAGEIMAAVHVRTPLYRVARCRIDSPDAGGRPYTAFFTTGIGSPRGAASASSLLELELRRFPLAGNIPLVSGSGYT